MKRSEICGWLLGPLRRDSGEPLHTQLQKMLRHALACEDLPPGTRLPSTRTLARSLAVSRNTVLYVYEALTAEGCLRGRTGSGTWVAGTSKPWQRTLDLRRVLQESQFPSNWAATRDPDGNLIVLHR